MQMTPIPAFMLLSGSMLNIRPTITVVSTSSTFKVQRIKHLGIQRARLYATKKPVYMILDQETVLIFSLGCTIKLIKVTTQQSTHGGISTRVASLINLVEEPSKYPLRFFLCVGSSRRYKLTEVVALSGDRVVSNRDSDAQRSTWEPVDATSIPRLRG
jgi:hypothetical protein